MVYDNFEKGMHDRMIYLQVALICYSRISLNWDLIFIVYNNLTIHVLRIYLILPNVIQQFAN